MAALYSGLMLIRFCMYLILIFNLINVKLRQDILKDKQGFNTRTKFWTNESYYIVIIFNYSQHTYAWRDHVDWAVDNQEYICIYTFWALHN